MLQIGEVDVDDDDAKSDSLSKQSMVVLDIASCFFSCRNEEESQVWKLELQLQLWSVMQDFWKAHNTREFIASFGQFRVSFRARDSG